MRFLLPALPLALGACAGAAPKAAVAPSPVPDRSVRLTSAVGRATNDVVPLPGLEMIRVAAVRESAPAQPGARSPNQEALTRGGGLPGTTVLVRVARP